MVLWIVRVCLWLTNLNHVGLEFIRGGIERYRHVHHLHKSKFMKSIVNIWSIECRGTTPNDRWSWLHPTRPFNMLSKSQEPWYYRSLFDIWPWTSSFVALTQFFKETIMWEFIRPPCCLNNSSFNFAGRPRTWLPTCVCDIFTRITLWIRLPLNKSCSNRCQACLPSEYVHW